MVGGVSHRSVIARIAGVGAKMGALEGNRPDEEAGGHLARPMRSLALFDRFAHEEVVAREITPRDRNGEESGLRPGSTYPVETFGFFSYWRGRNATGVFPRRDQLPLGGYLPGSLVSSIALGMIISRPGYSCLR